MLEARCLSSAWMARVAEQVAVWYKEGVPWQVRVLAGHFYRDVVRGMLHLCQSALRTDASLITLRHPRG